MFWKKKRPTADELVQAEANAIVASLGPKWEMFCEEMPFKAEVPLSMRIDAFAVPAMAGMLQHYPSTKYAPAGALWMMIFTAVMESGTHSQAEVNAAVAELEAKYAS